MEERNVFSREEMFLLLTETENIIEHLESERYLISSMEMKNMQGKANEYKKIKKKLVKELEKINEL